MQNNYSSDRATPPTSIKKNFKRIVLTGITLCLVLCVIFSFAACLFGGDDDADPTTPGQTEPETPSSDSDNPDNSNENDDDGWDDVIVPDDPVIDPDDPVIDPDDPVIDPDDPVIDPDPSDPTDPINPGDSDTSDFPKSIYEVDEIDEINYFADEFVQILNDNYLDNIAHEMIYINDTSDFENPKWSIYEVDDNVIKKLRITVYHSYGTTRYFSVGQVSFNQTYYIQDIIDGNATKAAYSIDIMASTSLSTLTNNTDLGKTVISTIDPDNTLEGDIWCSYYSPYPGHDEEGYWDYYPVKVYQITEKGVEKFEMRVKKRQYDHESGVDKFINQIKAGLYSSKTQTTEYTFTGMKIEQIPLPEEA